MGRDKARAFEYRIAMQAQEDFGEIWDRVDEIHEEQTELSRVHAECVRKFAQARQENLGETVRRRGAKKKDYYCLKESTIEKQVSNRLKGYGTISIKVGRNGWPDRMYITPNGFIFWIEFKTESGRLSKLQEETIAMLRRKNQRVEVICNENQEEALSLYKLVQEHQRWMQVNNYWSEEDNCDLETPSVPIESSECPVEEQLVLPFSGPGIGEDVLYSAGFNGSKESGVQEDACSGSEASDIHVMA